MELGEALSTAAQIAVALAAFAGVVVVLRRESVDDWSPGDKFRLRLLLTHSIFALALCVIGLLLLTISRPLQGVWRSCSAVAVVIDLPFAITTSGSFRRLGSPSVTKCARYRLCVLPVSHSGNRRDVAPVVQRGSG